MEIAMSDDTRPDRGQMQWPEYVALPRLRDECLTLLTSIQDFRTGSLMDNIINYELLPIVSTTLILQALLEKFVMDHPADIT
jgi:hypothetical protein